MRPNVLSGILKARSISCPCVTLVLTVLCGTGHAVYTMLPIIADIAIKKNIRPRTLYGRLLVCPDGASLPSPVSVATVSIAPIIAKNTTALVNPPDPGDLHPASLGGSWLPCGRCAGASDLTVTRVPEAL